MKHKIIRFGLQPAHGSLRPDPTCQPLCRSGKGVSETIKRVSLIVGILMSSAWLSSMVAKPIELGLGQDEGSKYNVEFMQFDRMQPVYKENGIEASLFDISVFYSQDQTEEQIYQMLKQYDAVQVTATSWGVPKMTPAIMAREKVARAALVRYVQDGGGLLIQPQPVRYPTDEDEKVWNFIFEPFGAQVLHEGIYDTTRTFKGLANGESMFWYTSNIQSHPVTQGVKSLSLPWDSGEQTPGTVSVQYSPDWQVVVSGEKEAKSYQTGKDNAPSTIEEGTYKSAPPVVAVRQFGKGRVACYPISWLFTGLNYGDPVWANVVESAGDRNSGRASDGMKLQMNCYHWLAEPAQQIPGFGTYKAEPYQPVEFPKSINLDGIQFGKTSAYQFPDGQNPHTSAPVAGVRGIAGAHTTYTDGKGSVEDYAKAAKAEGLSFIIFTDPLEKLTPETLEKLKTDCAAASKDPSFYACPGFEFTDGDGDRWVFWGEKIVYPDKSFVIGSRTLTQWDGKRVNYYGQFMETCGYPGSAVLDYKQLRANGAHPENLWWFYDYLPLAYEKDRLIADNYGEYLHGLRDLRWASLLSYTRIDEPADVGLAARTLFTQFPDLDQAKKALNTTLANYNASWWSGYAVSQGPVIASWEAINSQLEDNWAKTRGAQRVRLHFDVRSDNGIAEVKVHDADQGVIRRFDGHGAKDFSREFEMVDDKQHYVTLEVTDKAGKRAFSPYYFIFSYKQGLYRCSDNLNILSMADMNWHPDRNQMVPLAKNFENGWELSIRGIDCGVPLCPTPTAWPDNTINIKGVGPYPSPAGETMVGALLDLVLSSYNMQIVTMHMDNLAENVYAADHCVPAWSTVPKDVGENQYFARTDTTYAPMDRLNGYTSANYRRLHEGLQDYRGSFLWHEGEIRFKKDVTLSGDVPIPLARMACPLDLSNLLGNFFVVTDADGVTHASELRDMNQPLAKQGNIRPGGYASPMTTQVGYQGFLAPVGTDFTYVSQIPGQTTIGLGHDGQQIKAGTVMKYRFVIGDFADAKADNKLLEHTIRAMNFTGGSTGYPIEMKVGEVVDAIFFFTAKAKNHEASYKLGPQDLLIDLPIRVQGVEDNGCAAVFSTKRPWFRFVSVVDGTAYFQEPIDEANEMWVGNIFVADNKAVKITVVVDGQSEGKNPFIEAHNPTNQALHIRITSPAHTPLFGGMTASVDLPAGESVFLTINEKQFEKRK